MRFITITTVAASVALAMGAVLASDENIASVCNSGNAKNPVCCSTDVLGVASLDCTTREFSLRLRITGDHLSTLSYLQPEALSLQISPTSRICATASKLNAAPS